MNDARTNESSDVIVARAEVLTEGFKGLLLVNGGGAVALLALAQATWTVTPAVARLALVSTVILASGLAIALLVPTFRYFHARAALRIEGANKRTPWWFVYWVCMFLSVIAFIVSVVYLTVGGLSLLPPLNRTTDETAIRATNAANEAASNKRDPAGIAATYTTDGDLWVVGRSRISGREAIRQTMEAYWSAAPPDERVTLTVDNIRFLNSDAAIVEGSSRHRTGSVQTTSHATWVYVRQSGTWLIAAVRVMEQQ